MQNNSLTRADESNLLRRQHHHVSISKDEQEWKQRLANANRADQDFLMTTPDEQAMNLHLTTTAREIGVPESLREQIIEAILKDIYGYSILTELKLRPKVTTIWAYGDDRIEYAEGGKIKTYEYRFQSIEEVYRFIEKKLSGTTYKYARNIPEIDAILADGSRFHIMQGSAGISVRDADGRALTRRMPLLTIRQFVYPYRLDEMVKDKQLRTYLEWLPQLGEPFVIAGNQGAGKTTLLNAMTAFVPTRYHLITIEEAPEMQPLFKGVVVRLWNQGEINEFHFVSMIKNTRASLRMTGDVMTIGEIRDEDTTWEYLRITNIGLYLTATTLHADNVQDTIFRLMTLGIASKPHPPQKTVLDMIARGVSHVIYLRREGEYMGIQEVAELTGYEQDEIQLRTVFERDIVTGETYFHGLSERMKAKAIRAGMLIKGMID